MINKRHPFLSSIALFFVAAFSVPMTSVAPNVISGYGDGVGVVFPPVESGYTIYLFNEPPDYSTSITTDAPADSIVFEGESYNLAVRHDNNMEAFRPLGYKLDYGIFFFRCKTASRFWYEIILDESSGRSAWVEANDMRFSGWAEFMLTVNSVERVDKAGNPLRVAPDSKSAVIPYSKERECLEVLSIRGEWMRVRSSEVCGEQEIEDAWIQWKSGDSLLISYNLLS